jgi:hypothetical protein
MDGRINVSDPARQLTDDELCAIAGISARTWAAYTELQLIVDPSDPAELILVEWPYSAKLWFVLAVAMLERTHATLH